MSDPIGVDPRRIAHPAGHVAHSMVVGQFRLTRSDRPVLATLRAAWSPSLSERFVVILKDQAADVALAPVVVDLNGVRAIAERVDPRVERWQHPHSPTLGRLRTRVGALGHIASESRLSLLRAPAK